MKDKKKYKLTCKKDYSENRRIYGEVRSVTYLFRGEVYDVEEELWFNNSINPITGMVEYSDPEYYRKVLIPPSFVAFLTNDIFEHFYTDAETRDMKLKQLID
jgi:hypothetical protein